MNKERGEKNKGRKGEAEEKGKKNTCLVMKLKKLGRSNIIKWIQTFLMAPSYYLELCKSCILRRPGGERIVDIVPGGTELEI